MPDDSGPQGTDGGVDSAVGDSSTDSEAADASMDASERSTCGEQYGGAPGFELCEQQADRCVFEVATTGGTCADLCERHGGTCITGFDNPHFGDTSCMPEEEDGCDRTRTDEICVCSRSAVSPMDAGTDAGTDAAIIDAGVIDPVDPALTTNAAQLARARTYEQMFFDNLESFQVHLDDMFTWYTNEGARGVGYSSASGYAMYHTLDDLCSLSFAMTVAEPARRAVYAEIAKERIDRYLPLIASGEGTEGCDPPGSSISRCSPGYYRYLDLSHGLGGLGIVMRALRNEPVLRVEYQADLLRWATAMEPVMLRARGIMTNPNANWENPHMPGKIAHAFLAVGEILENEEYIELFWRVVAMMVENMDSRMSPSGWVGSDVSHAAISNVVLTTAYMEQLRGSHVPLVTEALFAGLGESFVVKAAADPRGHTGTIIRSYGTTVRLSESVRARAADTYEFTGTPGVHPYGRVGETVTSLAIGHALRITADP